MKKLITTIFGILISYSAFTQDSKTIIGDTTFWLKHNRALSEKIGLKDFLSSTDDFNFRYWNQGQIIEITKINDLVSGNITNYTFRQERKNKEERDTLFEILKIENQLAFEIYMVISDSTFTSLPSDNMIDGWSQGTDGIEYIFETANKNNYSYKTYWTPSAQDSIKESLIILNLVNEISKTLNLREIYKHFQSNLPHKGCYSSGGMSVMCYIPNTYEIGYYGSTKLPLGYSVFVNLLYVGDIRTDFGFNVQHQFDLQENYDLSIRFNKWNLFLKQESGLQDFLSYNYRLRKIEFMPDYSEFQNHKMSYGLTISNSINIGLGVDWLIGDKDQFGGLIYATKWFNNPKFSIEGTTSLFNDHLDYKIGLSKLFNFRDNFPFYNTSIRLSYESFQKFRDLSFSVSICF